MTSKSESDKGMNNHNKIYIITKKNNNNQVCKSKAKPGHPEKISR